MNNIKEGFVKLVGIKFRTAGRIYYYNSNDLELKTEDTVIVQAPKGIQIGEVVIPPTFVPKEKANTYNILSQKEDSNYVLANLSPATLDGSIDSEPKVPEKLNEVIRIATKEDLEQEEENKKLAKNAHKICFDLVKKHKLSMKLVSTELTHDAKKVIFYFTSNGRVDFRELVKDLLQNLKHRIELRQIDARDESKIIGGIGKCGQKTCCSNFLRSFKPVSIKMAKEQNLALNPTKVSGICGRLLCCLTYELETYNEIKKRLPRVGSKVKTPNGIGKVIKVNIFSSKITVLLDSGEIARHEVEEIKDTKKIDKETIKDLEYAENIHKIPEEETSEEELKALEDPDEVVDIKDTFIKGKPRKPNKDNNKKNYKKPYKKKDWKK
jgi:cell fate regulator YaaT (PSP1 superfamily)